MGAKNSLVDADARLVEEKFQSRMMVIAPADAGSGDVEQIAVIAAAGSQRGIPAKNVAPTAIDKSQLALPEPRRLRDKVHLRFVSTQPCLVCGRRPSDAHHLRFAQHPALGRKVSDEFTVPVCRTHHREIHRSGDEAAWWERTGIDVVAKARALWIKTHPVGGLLDNGNQSSAGLGAT